MRTFVHAAFLAALLLPNATPVFAADLDHYYEPPGPAMGPPPPRRWCGYDRPCFRPHPRYGYLPRYPGYRPYAGPVDRFDRPRDGYAHDDGYAYARPRIERMPPRDERERYGEPGPRYGTMERDRDEPRWRGDERDFREPRDYGRERDPYDRG
jgi:hypothetical protein